MNINEVKELMDKFDASSLREFDWKNAGDELSFSKNSGLTAPSATVIPTVAPVTASSAVVEAEKPADSSVSEPKVALEGEAVKSPLVGVAYLKPAPEKANFVAVGDSVKKGQTLLIIEAMKVMNEIPAPKDGVVTEIMVSAEEVVEYGQALVRIK